MAVAAPARCFRSQHVSTSHGTSHRILLNNQREAGAGSRRSAAGVDHHVIASRRGADRRWRRRRSRLRTPASASRNQTDQQQHRSQKHSLCPLSLRPANHNHPKEHTHSSHPLREVNSPHRRQQLRSRSRRSHGNGAIRRGGRTIAFDRSRTEHASRSRRKARAGQRNRPAESRRVSNRNRRRPRRTRRTDNHLRLIRRHHRKKSRLNGERDRRGTRAPRDRRAVKTGISAIAGRDCMRAGIEREHSIRSCRIPLAIQSVWIARTRDRTERVREGDPAGGNAMSRNSRNVSPQIDEGPKRLAGNRNWIAVLVEGQNRERSRASLWRDGYRAVGSDKLGAKLESPPYCAVSV